MKSKKTKASELPNDRQPELRVTTMPNDANPAGDIFGGWLMSQIDIAAGIVACQAAKGPVVTVAVKELRFIKPLFVHNIVSFYADVQRVGSSSVTVEVDVYAESIKHGVKSVSKISEAVLIFVAVSEPGKKRTIPKE